MIYSKDNLLSLLFLLKLKKKRNKRKLKINRLLILKRYLQLRTRNYVTKQCLRPVYDSDWMKVFEDADDGNLISLTSLNRAAFTLLLDKFSRHYKIKKAIGSNGRPSTFQHHHQALGCLLTYYCDTKTFRKYLLFQLQL